MATAQSQNGGRASNKMVAVLSQNGSRAGNKMAAALTQNGGRARSPRWKPLIPKWRPRGQSKMAVIITVTGNDDCGLSDRSDSHARQSAVERSEAV